MQIRKRLAQGRAFEGAPLGPALQGPQLGCLPTGLAAGLQGCQARFRHSPGRIGQGIHHQLQAPGARVALVGEGCQCFCQAGIGAPQAEHHLRRRPASGWFLGPALALKQQAAHLQIKPAGEQGLHAQGEDQGPGQD